MNTLPCDRRENEFDRRDYPRIPLTDRRSMRLFEALDRQLNLFQVPHHLRKIYKEELFGLILFSRRHPRGIRKRQVESYILHRIESDEHVDLEFSKTILDACHFMFDNVYGENPLK